MVTLLYTVCIIEDTIHPILLTKLNVGYKILLSKVVFSI